MANFCLAATTIKRKLRNKVTQLHVMLPVTYWGISNIDMSNRIFIYIFTNY